MLVPELETREIGLGIRGVYIHNVESFVLSGDDTSLGIWVAIPIN